MMMKYHGLALLLLPLWLAAPAQAATWKAFSSEGGQAPAPMVLADIAGREIDLASLRGEVVLVNFWATWCEPCREEMPSLQRLQHKLGAKGFRVVAVNVGEGAARIRQFLERTPVSFTMLRNADSEVMKAWRVRMLPASFLVDRKGMRRYQIVGEADYEDPVQQAPILELLK